MCQVSPQTEREKPNRTGQPTQSLGTWMKSVREVEYTAQQIVYGNGCHCTPLIDLCTFTSAGQPDYYKFPDISVCFEEDFGCTRPFTPVECAESATDTLASAETVQGFDNSSVNGTINEVIPDRVRTYFDVLLGKRILSIFPLSTR